jgi:hypothetical protein
MNERRTQGDDLTGRRQGYNQLKKELHHFFSRILVVVAIIGITSTAGLFGFGFVLREIQLQREEACLDQNLRHDNALTALRMGSDEDIANAPNEAAKDEIRRRRDVTITLIEAVAPELDCGKIVQTGLDAYFPW